VIFALMLLSLLETILVTYLMEKQSQDKARLQGDWEDKRKQVNTENTNAGKSHISRLPSINIVVLSHVINLYDGSIDLLV